MNNGKDYSVNRYGRQFGITDDAMANGRENTER